MGDDADNSAAFSTAVDEINDRTETTASTTQATHPMHDGVEKYFVWDVTAIVQEIVDRVGWTSGNAMSFIFVGGLTATCWTASMSESASPPSIDIIYDNSITSAFFPTKSGIGTWTNPDNTFANDATEATSPNSINAAQIYENFNLPNLTGSNIIGVLVEAETFVSSTTLLSEFSVQLSWNGGTSWTTAKSSFQNETTVIAFFFGGADAWSHAFIPAELTNINFKVRIANSFASSSNDGSCDYITAQVFYTTTENIGFIKNKLRPAIFKPGLAR